MNQQLIDKLSRMINRRQEEAVTYHNAATALRKKALDLEHQVQSGVAALCSEDQGAMQKAIDELKGAR